MTTEEQNELISQRVKALNDARRDALAGGLESTVETIDGLVLRYRPVPEKRQESENVDRAPMEAALADLIESRKAVEAEGAEVRFWDELTGTIAGHGTGGVLRYQVLS